MVLKSKLLCTDHDFDSHMVRHSCMHRPTSLCFPAASFWVSEAPQKFAVALVNHYCFVTPQKLSQRLRQRFCRQVCAWSCGLLFFWMDLCQAHKNSLWRTSTINASLRTGKAKLFNLTSSEIYPIDKTITIGLHFHQNHKKDHRAKPPPPGQG